MTPVAAKVAPKSDSVRLSGACFDTLSRDGIALLSESG